jgi:hypothetical protein
MLGSTAKFFSRLFFLGTSISFAGDKLVVKPKNAKVQKYILSINQFFGTQVAWIM